MKLTAPGVTESVLPMAEDGKWVVLKSKSGLYIIVSADSVQGLNYKDDWEVLESFDDIREAQKCIRKLRKGQK